MIESKRQERKLLIFIVLAKTATLQRTNGTMINYNTNIVHTKLTEQGRHFAIPSTSTDISDKGSSSSLKAVRHTALKHSYKTTHTSLRRHKRGWESWHSYDQPTSSPNTWTHLLHQTHRGPRSSSPGRWACVSLWPSGMRPAFTVIEKGEQNKEKLMSICRKFWTNPVGIATYRCGRGYFLCDDLQCVHYRDVAQASGNRQRSVSVLTGRHAWCPCEKKVTKQIKYQYHIFFPYHCCSIGLGAML